VRRLLRGEEVDVQGKVITLERGKLLYKPIRSELPIYFATHGAQVAKLAGEIADGVLLANTVSPEELAPFVERIQAGLAVAGREQSSFDLCVRLEAAISEDEEAAFAVMKNRVVAKLLAEYPKWDYLARRGIELPDAFVELAAAKAPAAEAGKHLPGEVVGSLTLAGNAQRIAEQIAQVIRPEVTQICLRPWVARGQSVASVIEAFANDVMPRALKLAKAAASVAG
jgi:5,10-methylenetetrahydromethanopterin reductase